MIALGATVTEPCPVCETGLSSSYRHIDGYDYLQCAACGSLHVDRATLSEIDAGRSTRVYDDAYWSEELRSARERACSDGLVRAGEAILYARLPVQRFLDIGTGPGFLLDELSRQLPAYAERFHGVELFPPQEHTSHPNYHQGEIGGLNGLFDAGVCIEVVEHLTPKMLASLVRGLAQVSSPHSLWLFNTGMPDYVLKEDPGYLDPLHRGHIVSYGLRGLTHIFEPHGFRIRVVPGKSYAFVAEFQPSDADLDFEQRFYHPVRENRALLASSGLLFQAAFEAARASYYHEQYLARTKWALTLQAQLDWMSGSWLGKLPRPVKAAANRLFRRH